MKIRLRRKEASERTLEEYNEEWDACFDPVKDVWLEDGCGEDCEHYHCSKRPAKPSQCLL